MTSPIIQTLTGLTGLSYMEICLVHRKLRKLSIRSFMRQRHSRRPSKAAKAVAKFSKAKAAFIFCLHVRDSIRPTLICWKNTAKASFATKANSTKGKVFFKGSGKGWNYIPSLDDELDEIHGKGWKGKGKGPKGKVNIGFLCVSDDDDDDDDWKGKGKGPKGKVYILSLDDELDEIHGKGWKGKGKGPKGKVNIAALPDDDDELDEGHGKGWKGKGKGPKGKVNMADLDDDWRSHGKGCQQL